jgi:hypothetical protein
MWGNNFFVLWYKGINGDGGEFEKVVTVANMVGGMKRVNPF